MHWMWTCSTRLARRHPNVTCGPPGKSSPWISQASSPPGSSSRMFVNLPPFWSTVRRAQRRANARDRRSPSFAALALSNRHPVVTPSFSLSCHRHPSQASRTARGWLLGPVPAPRRRSNCRYGPEVGCRKHLRTRIAASHKASNADADDRTSRTQTHKASLAEAALQAYSSHLERWRRSRVSSGRKPKARAD